MTKAGLSQLPTTAWNSLEELLSVYVPDLPEPVVGLGGVMVWCVGVVGLGGVKV